MKLTVALNPRRKPKAEPEPASPEERDFRGALDADPADAVTRLVYADWLEENGRDDLAYAQRWMAAWRKWPAKRLAVSKIVKWWDWQRAARKVVTGRPSVILPSLVFWALPGAHPTSDHRLYWTAREAEDALVAALTSIRRVCPDMAQLSTIREVEA